MSILEDFALWVRDTYLEIKFEFEKEEKEVGIFATFAPTIVLFVLGAAIFKRVFHYEGIIPYDQIKYTREYKRECLKSVEYWGTKKQIKLHQSYIIEEKDQFSNMNKLEAKYARKTQEVLIKEKKEKDYIIYLNNQRKLEANIALKEKEVQISTPKKGMLIIEGWKELAKIPIYKLPWKLFVGFIRYLDDVDLDEL